MIHLKPEEIRELLREVYDPELGVNIVDLGLVYEIRNDDGDVYIRMTLTTPGCPLHDTIASAVERLLEGAAGDSLRQSGHRLEPTLVARQDVGGGEKATGLLWMIRDEKNRPLNGAV